jgi:hypothetical protein
MPSRLHALEGRITDLGTSALVKAEFFAALGVVAVAAFHPAYAADDKAAKTAICAELAAKAAEAAHYSLDCPDYSFATFTVTTACMGAAHISNEPNARTWPTYTLYTNRIGCKEGLGEEHNPDCYETPFEKSAREAVTFLKNLFR